MKKILLIVLNILIVNGLLYSQDSTITFKFVNAQIISGTPDVFQFDVQIKSNTSGTYHREMQIYFNYNTDAFGVNIVSNNKIVVEKIGLMSEQFSGADKYNIVGTNDNTSSRFAVATESNFPNFDPSSMPMFYTEVTTGFNDFLRFKIEIADNTKVAGVNFQEDLMNGGQYCQGNAVGVKYPDPNSYNNNLLTEPTWNVPATAIWSGASNTEWLNHSNWDNNAPWGATNVTIPDVSEASGNTPIISTDAQCNNLTINSGGCLTINSGNTLTISGILSLLSNVTGLASFIDLGTLNVSADINVDLYLSKDTWHYVSTPISNALSGVFNGIYLKYFNEPINDWTYIESTTVPLNVGQGYAEWTTSNSTVAFTGTLNSGNISPTLSFTDNDPHGFNFVGNPYPSSIDWDLIPSGNKVNLDATIYAWNGSNYVSYNGSIGGFTDGIIPPMQGFFVHANSVSPYLTFSNDARVHNEQSYYKKPLDALENILELRVDGNEYYDATYINFNPDATEYFDLEFDGYKLFGIEEAPQVYSKMLDKEYSINVLPEISNELQIPVSLKVGAENTYQILIDGVHTFDSNIDIYLEDLSANQMINLRLDSLYSFLASPNDEPDRFVIHFSDPTSLSETTTNDNYHIYANDKTIYISVKNDQSMQSEIYIYDLFGNCIRKEKIENNTLNKIPVSVTTGYYLVKLILARSVVTEKIFIH